MRVDLHEKLMLLIEEVVDELTVGNARSATRDIDGSAINIYGFDDDGVICLELYGLFDD